MSGVYEIEVAAMATYTLNGSFLFPQGQPATTRPEAAAARAEAAAARAAATAGQDAQSIGEQIRQQIRAEMQGGPPTPPAEPRRITIRGRNGEETVIGVPAYNANEVIPPQAVDIAFGFFWMVAAIVIGLPLARAFGRRMDRKGGTAQIPNEVSAQLTHLNQAIDAIALEVERISEGQRFTTRLLSEQRDTARQTLPSGANR